jgi:hypothetical protein
VADKAARTIGNARLASPEFAGHFALDWYHLSSLVAPCGQQHSSWLFQTDLYYISLFPIHLYYTI